MEFGPREVLIVLGALLVCGIVLDGVRRMRAARRGQLRGPKRQPIFDDAGLGDDPLNSELPSGGARVVAYRDEDAAAEISAQLRRSADAPEYKRTAPFRERQAPEVESGQASAPSVEAGEQPAEPELEPPSDPTLRRVEAEAPATSDAAQQEQHAAPEVASEPLVAERIAEDDLPLFRGEPAPPPPAPVRRGGRKHRQVINGSGRSAEREDETLQALVLHLMAPQGGAFTAEPLFDALQKAGLEFGDRHIFHRFLGAGSARAPSFSVANAVKPGTFDGPVREFQTPGVAFFMVIGGHAEPLAVFDDMLATARQVAGELGAELCDEHRSALTRQVIADYRQRILDYGRRRARSD